MKGKGRRIVEGPGGHRALVAAGVPLAAGAGLVAWYRFHPISAALWLERLGSRFAV